jgi:acid phosphatase type 7
MRRTAAFLLCWISGWSAARADVHAYIDAGAEHQYAVLRAPVPAQRFGELSVDTLARARAFFDRGGPTPRGDDAAEVPFSVPRAPFVGGASGGVPWKVPAPTPVWSPASPAPFGAPVSKKRSADCRTIIGDVDRERIAALYVKRTFRVGPELTSLRVLELRARYEDGLVAWINGVEVARVAVDPRGSVDGMAARSRGPEWETFFLAADEGLLRAGDNELVVEVRPSIARLAPSVDLALVGRSQARIVRGPLLLRTTEDSAIVAFETDVATKGEVRWGQTPSHYQRTVASPGRGTRHEVTLTGLPRDAEIHYQVVADDDLSADHAFHTSPGAGEVVRFVVFGDVRSGHARHAELVPRIIDEGPDFVIATGDMVMRGTDEGDWQKYFAIAGPLLARVAVYPVLGNHDLGESNRRRFEDIFALSARPPETPLGASWWSFDVGSVHVAMMDSNHFDDPRQVAWLDGDLAAARARGAKRLFAAAHHGAWSRGPHGGHAIALRDYAPIWEKHRVDVVFSGHDHLYQRGQVGRVRYVVSGGGGAPLYPQRCGGRGQRKCAEDGMVTFESAHHYVVVEVYRDFVRMCAKRVDGSALEACTEVR